MNPIHKAVDHVFRINGIEDVRRELLYFMHSTEYTERVNRLINDAVIVDRAHEIVLEEKLKEIVDSR